MARMRATLVLVALISLLPIVNSAAQQKYETDWITPPFKLNDQLSQVCAIELEVNQQADQWTGTATYYSGNPDFDQFGDADKKQLPSFQSAITFRRVAPRDRTSQRAQDLRLELWEPVGEGVLPHLRLALSSLTPYEHRLLLTNARGYVLHVLPLQSEQRKLMVKQFPERSETHASWISSLFVGEEKRPNFITISKKADQLRWMHDANRLNLDAYGEVESATMLLYGSSPLSLTDLKLVDPTGEDRQVFRCSLGPARLLEPKPDKTESNTVEVGRLVMHPFAPGWHRLILTKEGRVERIIPLHADRGSASRWR